MSIFTMFGPSSRLRSTQKQYKSYLAGNPSSGGCIFCDEAQIDIRKNFDYFRLLGNRFPYESWDDHQVKDHLMLAPIRHTGHINEFTDQEKVEYIKLLGSFESQGYSVYSRAPVDVTRSVDHFHTHLLKIDTQDLGFMVYIRKPHFVLRHFRSKQ